MSNRIFVNTRNDLYRRIVNNPKGFQFGLGVPTELTEDERNELQQQAYEIFFSSDDLREKRRKIQILIDSLTDPRFFGDGSVKIDKVEKYLTDLKLEAERVQANNNAVFAAQLAAGGYATAAGVATAGAVASTTGAVVVNGALVSTGGLSVGAAAAAFLPVAGIVAAAAIIGNIVKSFRQAGREDNAAPWKMTRADFPNITSQAIQNSPTRRSIERLYDDRSGIATFNVSTEEAIALLVRETLADALFCTSNAGGTAQTSTEHPGPGGNGSAERWVNKDALRRHFSFTQERTGVDKVERTYVNALTYLLNYTSLIDQILDLQQPSLSRSPDTDEAQISIPLRITLTTANVQLFDALTRTARQVIREKVLTFFDKDREYKTLLNFGEDRQYIAEAWRLAPKDSGSVQLKLLKPLQPSIQKEDLAFISRELAKSVVDTVEFELAPLQDTTPYLRPYNMDARNYVDTKMSAVNTTLTTLGLATASQGAIVDGTTISYGDSVFRRWFSGDFKASELNIDFTNYNNFVHFGSAYKRLDAFTQKLKSIDTLTSASISSSVSSSTVSLLLKAREKENIIRNFDPYEQFLYYADSTLPYSASAFYVDGEIEYNSTGSWPKQNDGTPYSPYSVVASNWLTTQLGIAERYDQNNPNYLILNLPKHIQEDAESDDYLKFFEMFGHLMDNIKVYIDQFPYVYSTNINPLEELSMDQVYEVAKSFGLKLPNVYALENLQTFNAQFIGDSGSRSYVTETWKRFLHSMTYFSKIKGSRTSFDALLKTYGINSPVLQIKETTYPSTGNYIKSDELTYGLKFTASLANSIKIPFVSSSLTASTLQVTFNPGLRQQSSLVSAGTWAIDLVPHPSASKIEYGRIEVVSGSSRTRIASSSYFKLFSNDDDYTNLMLRSQSQDITIIQTDGDQILYQSSASVSLGTLWDSTTFVYIGSGSLSFTNNFDGIVDEIRVWGENISVDDFIAQAYDPGSYYGATYTSSYNNLYVHVPFSQPLSSITQSVNNESPYQNVSIISTLSASNFTTASFSRILRTIKQFTPIVGSTIYTNKKVNVAPAPVFNKDFVDDNGTKLLSRYTSIKKVEEKQYDSGQNIVSFAVSPTDFVNQNIMRSMGVIDVNNIIGSPRYTRGTVYSSLYGIQKDYIEYFNKTVKPNDYIRFFKDLTQGPSEMADEMAPARAKLLDGIVIESPVIYRNKETSIYYRSIAVDGTQTKTFNNYVSGSGSAGVGAYSFDEMIEPVSLLPDPFAYTQPLEAAIPMTGSIQFKSSTKSSKLPRFRRVIQKINDTNIPINSYSYVTSSFLDENSSYATLEAIRIDTRVTASATSSGYARDPFLGTKTVSQSVIIATENNTTTPFYAIPPRSDLGEVGTTSYFHKFDGIYSYDIYTKYKTPYLVRLDTSVASLLDRLFAKITLLSPSSSINYPGRRAVTIPSASYAASSYTTGTVTTDNIFSLFSVTGPSGIRLRLYKTDTARERDKDRPFSTYPTVDAEVLYDGQLGSIDLVFPYLLIHTTDGLIYYSVNNDTGSEINTAMVLSYYRYEAAPFIPIGYLPRHYKFSRDNRTAIKRRNYLGCRDVNVTFDNQTPVVINVSNSNTILVNSTTIPDSTGTGTVGIPQEGTGIQFGGAGILDVD
jgi:hypothetical protein